MEKKSLQIKLLAACLQGLKRIVLVLVWGLVFCDLDAQNFEWANKGEAIGNEPSIAVDASGNSYIYGYFTDTITFGS
ncbi:MAG TPA: hypothetical protein VJY62_00820, partial [Bacteroidia bacterium]|nr:hypothetical protein [Bacteroidia bacterium]